MSAAVLTAEQREVLTEPEVEDWFEYRYLASPEFRRDVHRALAGVEPVTADGLAALALLGVGEIVYTPTGTPLARTLDSVSAFLRRFIVFQSPHHADVVALWVAHTYAVDAWEATSYLAVTSPEKQSGKTRVLEVLELLVANPWKVTEPSTAVLFRKLEQEVTLLLDEVDAIFAGRDETAQQIRGVLNVGNRRGGTVARALDFGRDLHDFPVFGPKALAGIGSIPETLADRSIPLPMQRRRRIDRMERLLVRDIGPVAEALRERLREVVQAEGDRLAAYRLTDPPEELGDRQVEGWEPLFALAEAAGGRWPDVVYEGAVAVHAIADDESRNVLLLQHIRDAFEERGRDRLFTRELLSYLRRRDDGPWARWWPEDLDLEDLKGASGLAQHLKGYGIRSGNVRVGDDVAKGYRREDFTETWERYL